MYSNSKTPYTNKYSLDNDDDFERMVAEGEYEIDSSLYNLRKAYYEMKKERQKNEQDAQLLRNKIKLLQNEQMKTLKKEEKVKRTQEENDKIRMEMLLEKEYLYEKKKQKEEEILQRKIQITETKEKIKVCLSTWRDNVKEKNKTASIKQKMQRMENEMMIELNKKENEQKKKMAYETIKVRKLNSHEKRKQVELEKKMKLKQELEEKIKNEERQMNLLNKTLNDYQQQEEFLIRKIQSTKIDLKESSPGRQTFSRMRTNSTEK